MYNSILCNLRPKWMQKKQNGGANVDELPVYERHFPQIFYIALFHLHLSEAKKKYLFVGAHLYMFKTSFIIFFYSFFSLHSSYEKPNIPNRLYIVHFFFHFFFGRTFVENEVVIATCF